VTPPRIISGLFPHTDKGTRTGKPRRDFQEGVDDSV
jgi:hypothetical protein